jgi:hypothetical protein
MRQIEIFFASNTKAMKEQVNIWLKEHKNAVILKMLQNTSGLLGTMNGGSIIITILYEE